jgi:hypothetical protein
MSNMAKPKPNPGNKATKAIKAAQQKNGMNFMAQYFQARRQLGRRRRYLSSKRSEYTPKPAPKAQQ